MENTPEIIKEKDGGNMDSENEIMFSRIIIGFVHQNYNKYGQMIDQQFVESDQVEFEDYWGHPIEEPSDYEDFLPEMLQPSDIEYINEEDDIDENDIGGEG